MLTITAAMLADAVSDGAEIEITTVRVAKRLPLPPPRIPGPLPGGASAEVAGVCLADVVSLAGYRAAKAVA